MADTVNAISSSISGGANTMYRGAIALERGKTLMGAICGTLIGMCICSVGIYLFFKKTVTAEATVKFSSCNVVEGKTICSITIDYLVGESTYTATTTSTTSYVVGTKLTITYDPSNPNSVTLPNKISNTIAGLGSMACAVCLVVVGWGWWYVTNKYESVAAVQAVGDTLSILRR